MNELVQRLRANPSASSIAESVEQAVASGRLEPGQRLPPIRTLARELDVSPTTVASGYRILRERCVIVTAGRSGTRVNPRTPVMLRQSHTDRSGVTDLSTSQPDPALLPDLGAVGASVRFRQRQYAESAGESHLLELVRSRFERDGIGVGELCLVHGGMDGVHRALQERLRLGDKVAVEDPCAWATLDLLQLEGWTPVPVGIDDCGMKPEALLRALREGVRAVLVSPRAQNPMGAALDEARARELRAALDRWTDVMVVEDDYGADIVTSPPLSVCAGRDGPWAIERSFAKSHGPDIRVGVVNGDERTIQSIRLRMLLTGRWISNILQDLVVALLESPEARAQVDEARRTYDHRRQALMHDLGQLGIESRGRTGLNLWIPVPEESSVVQGMYAKGWAISGGGLCRLRTPPAVRISTGEMPVEDAPRLAADLASCLGVRASARPARPALV